MIGIMSAKEPISTDAAEPPKAVLIALKKLLKPLVRLLLSFQITLPYLIELLKRTYVEVADEDFKLDSKKQTDTRISLLTGVHRKDTRRLRNPETLDESPETNTSIGAQLVAQWISQPQYLDEFGEPRPLPFKASEDELLNGQVDFEGLVVSVCKQDIRARVVLDEWLRVGMATLSSDQTVTLNRKAFLPDSNMDQKAFFLGMNLADHIEAASQNLISENPPFIERCVYYDGLCAEAIEELNSLAEQQGMAMLQVINKRALELLEDNSQINQEAPEAEAHQRMNLGFYFYHQPDVKKEDKDETS